MNRVEAETSIRVLEVTKKLGRKTVLDNLTFTAGRGNVIGLLGPNGAGKTTLMRLLSTLMRPDRGCIEVAGHHLPREAALARRVIGFVSHASLLYPALTAEENLKFYARLYGMADTREEIQGVLDLVGLYERRTDLVRTFSRGMQQRLALGRAVLHSPKILLLDEPFNGLDLDGCDRLAGFIQKTVREGMTVVLASHLLAGVELLADRFDILISGRLVKSYSKADMTGSRVEEVYRECLSTGKGRGNG